jgi:ATP-dependent DNA ligase
VIAKRRDSTYEPGRRSGAWVKMRINKGQELVVGGYVPASKNFDSLIVGYYEGESRDWLVDDAVRCEPLFVGAAVYTLGWFINCDFSRAGSL